MHHDAGLLQSQKLLGIRQPEPARRLERLGHIRDLAGGADAEHRAETNDHEVAATRSRFVFGEARNKSISFSV